MLPFDDIIMRRTREGYLVLFDCKLKFITRFDILPQHRHITAPTSTRFGPVAVYIIIVNIPISRFVRYVINFVDFYFNDNMNNSSEKSVLQMYCQWICTAGTKVLCTSAVTDWRILDQNPTWNLEMKMGSLRFNRQKFCVETQNTLSCDHKRWVGKPWNITCDEACIFLIFKLELFPEFELCGSMDFMFD